MIKLIYKTSLLILLLIILMDYLTHNKTVNNTLQA